MDNTLFLAYQYFDDMNDPFVGAALEECMRILPDHDFFKMPDYEEFNNAMRAYLMR